MFRYLIKNLSKASGFEKMLLAMGISIGLVGFWFINKIYLSEPIMNWSFITAVFLWLLLIFVVILTDSNESIKEELSLIMKEHIEETKLLKKEVELLRQERKK